MRRVPELDGLRGIAAIVIVIYHLFGNSVDWLWAAVDLFFVLSGYLITTIILEHGSSWHFLKPFYARRGLRIWPIYFLLTAVLAVVWREDPWAIPYYATYTQRLPLYWSGKMPVWNAMNHTWTLALEEQFYLIWPPLLLLVGRRWTIPLAAGVALMSVDARLAGFDWWTLAGRCDGFALGGLLAGIFADDDIERARRRAAGWGWAFGLGAAILVGGLVATDRATGYGGPLTVSVRATVASLGSFAIVAAVVCHAGRRRLSILRSRPLLYLGTISYGLYLFHCPIFEMSAVLQNRLGITHSPQVWLAECLLTLGLAAASWRWIEKPLLRLKDRIPYQRINTNATIEITAAGANRPGDVATTFAS